MATKALKIENSGKIASFVARYSNKSTGSGYKSAIESFLRCMNNLPKTTPEGKKATYDYESLFNAYITEKRDHSDDMEKFAETAATIDQIHINLRQLKHQPNPNQHPSKNQQRKRLRKRNNSLSYTDWQKMGFSKGTLHYMKKNAECDKTFTLNKHVRERVDMWDNRDCSHI